MNAARLVILTVIFALAMWECACLAANGTTRRDRATPQQPAPLDGSELPIPHESADAEETSADEDDRSICALLDLPASSVLLRPILAEAQTSESASCRELLSILQRLRI
jgi:hypothetical protein